MKLQLIAAAIAAFIFASPAEAETTICTEIPALPFTISAQGTFCLKKNLNIALATGNAITVIAGNVTIDFNDFGISNTAPNAEDSIGIFARDRKNLTVRNGFIRSFGAGISLDETVENAAGYYLIEYMKITDSKLAGIVLEGDFAQARNNSIINTAVNSNNNLLSAIIIAAKDSSVYENNISGVNGNQNNVGIRIIQSDRVRLADNIINNIDGPEADIGIFVQQSDSVTFVGNKIINDPGTGTAAISGGGSTNLSCIATDLGGFGETPLLGCDVEINNRTFFN